MISAQLYRFEHGNGRSKDWAIYPWNGGVRIVHGSTGAKFRVLDYPAGSIGKPIHERISEQLKQGYQPVGEHQFNDKGQLAGKIPVVSRDVVVWDVPEPVDIDVLEQGLIRLSHLIGREPLAGTTVELDGLLLHIRQPGHVWSFGVGDAGGLIMPNTERGGGTIRHEDGPVALLAVLFLQKWISIDLAKPDGTELKKDDLRFSEHTIWQCWGYPPMLLREIAVQLELVIEVKLTNISLPQGVSGFF